MIFKKSNLKKKKEAIETQDFINRLEEKEVEEQNSDVQEISYTRATFWKRCSAILFDLITCGLLTLGIFTGARATANSIPAMAEKVKFVSDKQIDSGLFVYYKEKKRNIDVIDFYNYDKSIDEGAKSILIEKALNKFFTFIEDEISKEKSDELKNEFETLKFNKKMNKNGVPIFVKDENGETIVNPNETISRKDVNKIFYTPYVKEMAQGYFVSLTPGMYETQKFISNIYFFVEIPISLFLGFTLIYYIVPLIFYRGKQTFGRLLFQTGLVDKNVLSVSFGRFTARYFIFFFAEVILSIFTLGVPLFVSFSLMAFSKKKQNFHDYMLGIEEVDISSDQIYKSMDEIVQKPSEFDLSSFTPISKD